MLRDDGSPARLDDVLEQVIRKSGIDAGVRAGKVWSEWDEIVGDDIAEHAEPTSLRRGVLRVRTDSPVWATELTYLSDEIRRRANEVLGSEQVEAVKIWTAPGRVIRRPRARPAIRPAPVRSDGEDDPIAAFGRARSAWIRVRRSTGAQGVAYEAPRRNR